MTTTTAGATDASLDDDEGDDDESAAAAAARPHGANGVSGAGGVADAAGGVADAPESLLRRCHELLIAPVATHLEERLIVVPDQQLFALPFAALCDADGRSLLERHTIRVSPSIGVLRSRRTTHRAAPTRRARRSRR